MSFKLWSCMIGSLKEDGKKSRNNNKQIIHKVKTMAENADFIWNDLAQHKGWFSLPIKKLKWRGGFGLAVCFWFCFRSIFTCHKWWWQNRKKISVWRKSNSSILPTLIPTPIFGFTSTEDSYDSDSVFDSDSSKNQL